MSGGVGQQGSSVRSQRFRKGLVVGSVAFTMGLAGCSSGGSSPTASAPPGTPSATSSASPSAARGTPGLKNADEAIALMADYDARNNAAITAAVSFDSTGWEKADTGLALAADLMATALQQARNQPPSGDPITHSNAVPWAPNVDGSPQWVLVATDRNGTPNLYGFQRASATDPWRLESNVTLTSPLPAAPSPGAVATPNDVQGVAAKEAAEQVAATLAAGGQGPIALVGEAAIMVKRLDSDRSGLGAESVTITAKPDPEQGVRAVTAQDGSTLVLATHRVTATFAAKSGSSLQHGPDFAAVLGQPGKQSQLVYDFVLFSALRVNPGDAATMLGSSAGNLRPGS